MLQPTTQQRLKSLQELNRERKRREEMKKSKMSTTDGKKGKGSADAAKKAVKRKLVAATCGKDSSEITPPNEPAAKKTNADGKGTPTHSSCFKTNANSGMKVQRVAGKAVEVSAGPPQFDKEAVVERLQQKIVLRMKNGLPGSYLFYTNSETYPFAQEVLQNAVRPTSFHNMR